MMPKRDHKIAATKKKNANRVKIRNDACDYTDKDTDSTITYKYVDAKMNVVGESHTVSTALTPFWFSSK